MVYRMMSYILVSIVTAFTLLSPSDSTPGNCYGTHYKTINDPRRSTGYDVSAANHTRNHLCDRHLLQDNAWYRFSSEAGGEMPTTKPKLGSCGTYIPIWMNGSHPTIEDRIVARKACAYVPFAFPFGCGYSYNIHVRNCSGYYIYQLKTTAHCILAYCAGSKVYNCSTDPGSCIANRPPYISMPDQFYAFENSEFQLSINATDPEGYVMYRHEYLPNKTVSKVSIDDETVTISINQSGKVSLRITDGEDAKSSLHTINIIALPCPCMNEGKCKSNKSVSTVQKDFSDFTCDCIQPSSGKLCELSPCTNLPCYPRVICTITSDSYECGKCLASYHGDGKDCELILTDDIVVIVSELRITSGLKWDDGLSNKTSFAYKNLTVDIVNQISSAYGGTKEFLNIEVIRYRNEGVIVVEFQVVLKEKVNDPLEPLRTRAMQNDPGVFTIDPNSVREKENRPPYISMPDRYYALKDSEFQLVFIATDPEGYPLRYSYLSNTTISSVLVDQKRKLVNISVKESGSVSLKVRDYGGIEYVHTIQIVTIPCSCQNGGKCCNLQKNVSTVREDLSNFTCDCIQPYSGNLCQLSPCTNLPCFPGVICTVKSDSYECGKCPASYDGDGKDCELILTDNIVVIVSEMKITSGLKWDDGLSNEMSFTYKNLTVNIVNKITSAYGGTKEFLNVEVIRYRNESVVVVEFQVVLKEKMNDPLEPLRTRAMQNDSGIFTIDPNSVRQKENRPPYINMHDRYFALKDSEFQLVINATDPEGYPLRYNYLSNTTISSVSVDQNRKLVKISVKESGRVSLTVRDYGGLKYIHTIEVVTISCSCKNGGKCYNLQKNVSTVREDFSNFKCACVKPYTGRLCEVSPCDNLPCFPGVTCSVEDGRYKCGVCPATLRGDGKACQLILTDDTVVIEGEMKITFGLQWNDDLLNKTSLFYKQQTAKIVTKIAQAYADTKEFLNVVVIRYRFVCRNIVGGD
ncbi:onco -induced transcript 3 -like [Paramuricea clavata]|uniref:Onco -induced transcript 3 -like n=1 Tax=Paramuricea clavata TaxID=317549 RepID=A0A6S7HAY1_PARCT|nr:onco -induced transcript 3 -like [Paramuricea clavata]